MKKGAQIILAHGYRALQHWEKWLNQNQLGQYVLHQETHFLTRFIKKSLGENAILIGVPEQLQLLKTISVAHHYLISPFHRLQNPMQSNASTHTFIESDLYELPILTGSSDLVFLPHTLQFVDNPRQLLFEACRIVKPEGLIMVMGFNPFSMWGAMKFIHKKELPWSSHFIQANLIKTWLQLADFKMEKHSSLLFLPFLTDAKINKQFIFLEKIGEKCFSRCGGVYVLLARAKVIPLTPIKLKWKQKLSGIHLPTTLPGNIAR